MAVSERVPRLVDSPDTLWRVARGVDPLATYRPKASTRTEPGEGNRFDSPDGSYSVLHFGSRPDVCFGETLARLRPKKELAALVEDEWSRMGVMRPGRLPRDWREKRSLGEVAIGDALPFIDIDSLDTHQYLRDKLSLGLSSLGYDDLDISAVRGSDRRLTQMISAWAYNTKDEDGQYRFSGLRYMSRLDDDWECWAVFSECPLSVVSVNPIDLDNKDLVQVADRFGLHLF